MKKALERLLIVAREWRSSCVCATSDDNGIMDAAIEWAEAALAQAEKARKK